MKKTAESLNEIQMQLQKSIQTEINSIKLINIISEKPPISVNQRLKIYQNAYQIRLKESLRDDFSRVELVCKSKSKALSNLISENKSLNKNDITMDGFTNDKNIANSNSNSNSNSNVEIDFDKLATEFIQSTPSVYSNLAEYSQGFPIFIENNYPEFTEPAYTDWLEILSHHAKPNDSTLSIKQIQSGISFKIKLSNFTFLKTIHTNKNRDNQFEKNIVVFKKSDSIQVITVSNSLNELLLFLKTERTLNEVSDFIELKSLNAEYIMSNFQDWIKNEIICCFQNT